MNINDMTIGQAKELASMFSGECGVVPFEVGSKYLIRTVTNYWLGEITAIKGNFAEIKNASWVSDTGRFHKAVKGEFDDNAEIEYVGKAGIGLGSVVDFIPWCFELPAESK